MRDSSTGLLLVTRLRRLRDASPVLFAGIVVVVGIPSALLLQKDRKHREGYLRGRSLQAAALEVRESVRVKKELYGAIPVTGGLQAFLSQPAGHDPELQYAQDLLPIGLRDCIIERLRCLDADSHVGR